MDGTRDRPPGKTAENWSRRDGIRAGSVSGPWRSAPRGGEAPVIPHAPRTNFEPVRRVPLAPLQEEEPERRILSLGLWAGIGLVASAATVLAAFLLWPGRDATAPSVAPPLPEVPVASAPTTDEGAADPALAGVNVVRLRIGPDFPAAREAEILAALEAAGISGVRVEALPFRVASSRVGYYRADDLAAAEALGRLVTPVLAEAIGVRDYGKLLADPEPGRLDLWVES